MALAMIAGALPARPCHAQWRVNGAPVCQAANAQDHAQIIPDGSGGAIIAWQDFRSGTSYDIYAQKLNAAGVPQWPADGVAICVVQEDQEYPTLVSDGAGGAIILWTDERNGNYDIYAQRVGASGVPLWDADGKPVCTDASDQFHPTTVEDGVGGAIAAWEDLRSGNGAALYVQRVSSSGVQQWQTDGVPLLSARGTGPRYPQIVSDDAQGGIVVWEEDRGLGAGWDVYARRVNAAGVPQWSATGSELCTAAADQYYTTAVSDHLGGAIASWEDGRSVASGWDIYAQRVDVDGVPQWSEDGVPVCTAQKAQEYPFLVADGTGGAIFAWYDYRSSTTSDIYAQWVNVAGAPQWGSDGVALCTADRTQEDVVLASDGAGGAIVSWYDLRSGISSDIYAQGIDAAGAQWPIADGLAVCSEGSGQASQKIASDDAGGAIVTWVDYRGGNADIYAQRMYANGAVASVSPTIAPERFEMFAPSPNPVREGRLTIRFALPSSARVSAQVLDLAGHRVRTLATEREFSAGTQALAWDGRNDAGAGLPAGVYFARVRLGARSETRRVILLH
jgi:hypothetical protein